jgi:hypothetical protein
LDVPLCRVARYADTAPTIAPTNPADAVKENVHMRESSDNVNRIQ